MKRSHKKGGGIGAQAAAAADQAAAQASAVAVAAAKKKAAEDETLSLAGDDDEEGEGEPKYCYCQRVSYGEMVGCDYNKCKDEWFHLDCAGLDVAPTKNGKCISYLWGGGLVEKRANSVDRNLVLQELRAFGAEAVIHEGGFFFCRGFGSYIFCGWRREGFPKNVSVMRARNGKRKESRRGTAWHMSGRERLIPIERKERKREGRNDCVI